MSEMNKALQRSVAAAIAVALLSTSAIAGDITIIKAGSLFDSSNGKVTKDDIVILSRSVPRRHIRPAVQVSVECAIADQIRSVCTCGQQQYHKQEHE